MICKCCKKTEINCNCIDPDDFINSNEKTLMKELNICFKCAFWEKHARDWESGNKNNIYFIDGSRYHDCGSVDKNTKGFIGHGGREFIIQNLNTKEIIKTNNLWCQGDVPKEFKNRLPDNAIFINQSVLSNDFIYNLN
jgi:hypothetical protein